MQRKQHRRVGLAIALGLIFSAGLAQGDTTPIPYNGYISGFRVADVSLILDQKSHAYRGSLHIDATGVLGYFFKWEGTVSADGSIEPEGTFRPAAYNTTWASFATTGNGGITFDPASDIANGFWQGQPDEKVPVEQRHHVIDPITTFFIMQKALREQKYGQSEWRSYDGRHRADVHMTVLPPSEETIGERTFKVNTITTTYTPIAGFNPAQMESWPKSKSTLIFSDDDRHMLLQMKVETPNNTVMMRIRCADDNDPAVACP